MSSVIHYKFKNASGAWDQLSFEGSSLSVQQAKEAIVQQKRLNKQGGDFDLKLSNAQTQEGQQRAALRCTTTASTSFVSTSPQCLPLTCPPCPVVRLCVGVFCDRQEQQRVGAQSAQQQSKDPREPHRVSPHILHTLRG
jgi:hypothetical protein